MNIAPTGLEFIGLYTWKVQDSIFGFRLGWTQSLKRRKSEICGFLSVLAFPCTGLIFKQLGSFLWMEDGRAPNFALLAERTHLYSS